MDVTVSVADGIYPNQRTRWSLKLDGNTITIEGKGDGRTIFDGAGIESVEAYPKGQEEFLNIVRAAQTSPAQGSNLIVRGLKIRNYLEAILIHGASSADGYPVSNGGVIIEDNSFVDIGAAFSKVDEAGGQAESHGAIIISGSRGNVIRRNEFVRISNDAAMPPDYSTYGGLHAIYVLSFSSGTLIEDNTFRDVYARGVIKLRNFSNYAQIIGNRFEDNTSLVADQYCDTGKPVCASLPATECPSWGTVFVGNTYTYLRPAGRARPTIDLSWSQENEPYCTSHKFFEDSRLDPTDTLNIVAGRRRIITDDRALRLSADALPFRPLPQRGGGDL
jgi:hypothetical protein